MCVSFTFIRAVAFSFYICAPSKQYLNEVLRHLGQIWIPCEYWKSLKGFIKVYIRKNVCNKRWQKTAAPTILYIYYWASLYINSCTEYLLEYPLTARALLLVVFAFGIHFGDTHNTHTTCVTAKVLLAVNLNHCWHSFFFVLLYYMVTYLASSWLIRCH